MTAVRSWGVAGPTDAELAHAAASGDRGAFASIYDRYADRLHDFCVGMLRDRDSAADCVQDAFCTAATRLTQLREPDKLRPWLYAIARNEALRRLRERRRETPSDELPDMMSHEPGPDTLAARTELADLIAEAAGGLSDRDRSVLELAYRHGLDGPELADALGVSPGNANKMVYRLRDTIANSLGALLVSRRARNTPDGCPQLSATLGDWDGRFSVLMRKRITRHIESCPTCDEDRQRLVSPAALLGTVPVFIPAPAWLRERTLSDVRLDSLATPITDGTADPGAAVDQDPPNPEDHVDDAHGRGTRNVMLVVALVVAILVIALGLTIAWVYRPNTEIIPTDVTDTAPKTITTTPAAPTQLPVPPTAAVATTVPAITTPPPPATPPVQPPPPPQPPPVAEPPPPPAPPEPPPPAPPSDPEPPVQINPPPPPPPAPPVQIVPEPPPQAPERAPVIPGLAPSPDTPSLPGPIITLRPQPGPSISPPH